MIQFRPDPADLARLKEPFGRLIAGDPSKSIPKLKTLVEQLHPTRLTAVGDVVSRETSVFGISVDLRIIDEVSMRKPTPPVKLSARRTYHVRNPAGVITLESWEMIKKAMTEKDVLIIVEGEEDLLTLPSIVESPNNAIVVYGQPSLGLVVVETSRDARSEARLILQRMRREESGHS